MNKNAKGEIANGKNDDDNGTAQTEKKVENAEILPGYAKFDDYVKSAFGAMKVGIKAANSLPSGENFNYYSCFPKFNEIRNKELKRVLNVVQGIVELSGVAGSVQHRNIEETFELVVEANDIFLDRGSVCMDEEAGVPKKPGVALIVSQTNRKNVFGSWNATTASHSDTQSKNSTTDLSAIRLLAARNVQRPQLSFRDKIDNRANIWQPRITDKPNSLKPLALYLTEGENGEIFSHPYEFELDKFEPPECQLTKRAPVTYKNLDETPLIIIEKKEDIKILLDDLRKYNEIAVDLEHHSYRSFLGITCLMQISTRDTDYLIDALSLRSELHVLNEIFTKPTILKIFHGADCDIHWLQRDLSLYVVNMFDTHQAAKQLNLPYLSLAYLMKKYCNLDPNKHFQLADWRIRPLPEELMKYAREDTHYLLYIKDILRNDLVDSANGRDNIIRAVYDRSTEVCKRVYEKPVWNEDSCTSIYRRSQKMFNNRQLWALKELHKWRDETARIEDDSTGYVLPNHMLLNIAETLPREMQGILACCNPIPPLVRQNLLKLHKFILKAREQPLIKPVLERDIRQRLTQRNQAANLDVWIYTPHDTTSGTEVGANLPCLLNIENPGNTLVEDRRIEHSVTVFDGPSSSADADEATERLRVLRKKKVLFVSPFERYKRVMPMVAAQEDQERKDREQAETARNLAVIEDQERTAQSIGRVYEHFRNVVKNTDVNESPNETRRNASVEIPLGQMHGRKRKRQSDVADSTDDRQDYKYDVSTPKPSFHLSAINDYQKKRIKEIADNDGPKKVMKYEDGSRTRESMPMTKIRKKEKKKNQKNDESPKTETGNGQRSSIERPGPIRSKQSQKKGQKRANMQELQRKGMLPQQNFDYKSVDFSSFQGGSTTGNSSKSTQFQQKKKMDKIKKGKKRKKQKIKGI